MGEASDDDDDAIVREATPEVELGPPLELSAPFVPRPATESLWLIRVCLRRSLCGLCWPEHSVQHGLYGWLFLGLVVAAEQASRGKSANTRCVSLMLQMN